MVKGTMRRLGLLAMLVAMALAGVVIVLAETAFFLTAAILCGVGALYLFRCLPSHAA
jgi:hypothetical protein